MAIQPLSFTVCVTTPLPGSVTHGTLNAMHVPRPTRASSDDGQRPGQHGTIDIGAHDVDAPGEPRLSRLSEDTRRCRPEVGCSDITERVTADDNATVATRDLVSVFGIVKRIPGIYVCSESGWTGPEVNNVLVENNAVDQAGLSIHNAGLFSYSDCTISPADRILEHSG
jgi:hypothetical protein